jgi:hypothetical protein
MAHMAKWSINRILAFALQDRRVPITLPRLKCLERPL